MADPVNSSAPRWGQIRIAELLDRAQPAHNSQIGEFGPTFISMDFVEKLGLKPLPSTPGAWKQRSARYPKSRMAKLAAEMGTIFGSMILKENAVLGQTREPLNSPTSWNAGLSAQSEVSGERWHSGIGNLLGNSLKQMVRGIVYSLLKTS
ncbi:hypothetical protein CPAR01_12492 [Colletotrichum paranaense]|uniref:Uncharacterized protein n=1 Tax=Colletotrichum paranaense TaxID=1914294 RepID=A0ABQ9S7U7_9PEZI|nr:uncharacterized protein CPAR01_12492 [Colletotrichum paranaense]KAK1527934.1 hypothetical protein CPAR01_12492 [Colletotrichum paranaense]